VSSGTVLVLVFIVAPLVLAPIVIGIVARTSPEVPPELRISELLEHGEAAQAELLEWKRRGPFLFDSRPMVAFRLSVRAAGEPFELQLMQSVPRHFFNRLSKGMTLQVRVSPDHTAGAIVVPVD
jgi:hypothetical protein